MLLFAWRGRGLASILSFGLILYEVVRFLVFWETLGHDLAAIAAAWAALRLTTWCGTGLGVVLAVRKRG